ncbi:hypothetical protein NPIL_698011 [Nephila pilipes]|uniref:Uncharacterized protein n=1 Tax=Nephila pilipes TaxID=299642 RepID=A0A8X6UP81_NEPPI|nr:hypothetical protein NPIL_698011 [Nephila pilipes]
MPHYYMLYWWLTSCWAATSRAALQSFVFCPEVVSGEMEDDGDAAKVYYHCLSADDISEIFEAGGWILNLLWFYITSFVTGHSLGKFAFGELEARF